MRFDGAIFDVDGVLVDSPHERAWREALQRLMQGPWRHIAAQTSYTPERYTTEVYQAYVAGKPREAGARAALDYFGVSDPDGRRLREYCDTKQADLIALIERGEFVAFDDALRFLLALKAADVRIAAASSSKNANLFLSKVPLGGFATQYSFVKPDTTLLDLFDANVCGRDFAHGKPAPDIFLAAAAELRVPPERCFVVEDATSGVQAAKAGGMACVGVARLGDELLLRSAGADWVVTSLDELPVAELLTDEPRTAIEK
ncbi:MAG TPA: HAD-IA family hydrolase [Roseiflexaceae bacterium]